MTTLTVGTGSGFEFSTLASAIAASSDGDVIEVQPGTYTNDFATITTSITIIGNGGLVNLVATEAPPNLKGILTIGADGGSGTDVTIDNVSFSGAAIPNDDGGNGAGIRYQSGSLTLNNTYFYNNQEGLLADADPNGTITINNSEFNNNGNANPPSGVEHNLYVGAIQQLTVDNSYFDNPIVGHDIKSRAANTTIENSRIYDESESGSLEIDLPNGGNALIENNVIEKGPNAQNSNLISSGEEGNVYASSSLTVTGNTLINDDGNGVTGVVNDTGVPASVTGNTTYGLASDQIVSGPVSSTETNTEQPQSGEPALDTSPAYLPLYACFAAGTWIMTAEGQVPVEALRIGQQVVVVPKDSAIEVPRKNTLRAIQWIGHRRIDFTRHPCPLHARPIRIRAGAFADGVPWRDLLVSPDHAIYAHGLLIPARLLLNGATILREDDLPAIRYFHVELDKHDILLAEGLEAESYLDTGNRGIFENSDVPLLLHPDLAQGDSQARREALSCVPFAADVERVKPVWSGLAARASALGFVIASPATTTDSVLRLLIDGREHRPVTSSEGCHMFVLPRTAGSVRVVSRAAAPCDVMPWIEDRRRLGVAVARIVGSSPTGCFEMPPDDPRLTTGWWAAEQDGLKLWRWTNGDAVLPLPKGTSTVAIHLAGENLYLRDAVADDGDYGMQMASIAARA